MSTNVTRRDLFALLLILLAALAFVWPLFVPGWIIPQGGGDLVSFLWPTYRYAAHTLQQIINNQAPLTALLWNPTLYSGAPFAADNQTSLFYPPNLILFLLLPDFPYPALEALVAGHLFLAGAGMYLFMRSELRQLGFWKLEVGIFSAAAFMASDVFITHLGNYNIVAASAWLPFIFLGLRQSLRFASNPPITHNPLLVWRPAAIAPTNWRWALFTGLCFGLAILAGHAQMTFILALAGGLYGLYELMVQRHWRVVAVGAVAALVAFGLAALTLLPTLEMIQYTARSALSYAEATRWSLPPLGLIGMISPLVFGRGAAAWWPTWDRVEVGYMGVVALILVPFARGKSTRFFWLLALVGLVVALGKYTPVHYLLFKFVPGFASLRVPARFILLTNFAFAALAGFALASPWLSKRLKPGWLAVLLFAELFIFGAFVEVDRADPNSGYEPGPAVVYLLAQPGPTRIDVASGPWQPDAPAVFGLESITGITNPLALAHYDRYYWSVGYRGSPQYNFLNAQFVVAAKDSPPADSTFVPVFNEDPDVDVYLNTNAMPRVHLIYTARFVTDSQSAFAAVHAADFDPAAQVILESSPTSKFQPSTSSRQPPTSNANLFYTAYAPGHFTVVAQSPLPAYVVFAEVWYPGWVAIVNGQPAEIIRANSAFMAVAVPPGDSTLEFQFTSPLLVLGGVISIVTLSVSILMLVVTCKNVALPDWM